MKTFLGIVVGVLIVLWLLKAPAVSIYLTGKLGVDVTLQSISIWPKKTSIRDFRIANPPGFKSQTAFQVHKTTLDYQFSALTATPLEIDEIVLDKVELNVELRNPTGTDNNWGSLGKELSGRHQGRPVIIHRLVIQDMTVDVRGVGAKILGVSGKRHIAHMEFNEIDSREGFPTRELVQKIFEEAGIIKYLNDFLNPVRDILPPFNLFGENGEVKTLGEARGLCDN